MTVKITLDTKQFDDFAEALKKDAPALKRKLLKAMTLTAIDIQSTAKRPGYVPFDTGTLRRSITHEIRSTSSGISALIGSNLAYAAIHEFGGETGINKSVTIKDSRYIQRAIEDNEQKTSDRIKRAIAASLLK